MISVKRLQSVAPRLNLVLLHGFPFSSLMWEEMLRNLTHHAPDVNIYLVDFPGFGTSSIVEQWSMEEAAQELFEVLKKEGVEHAVIGGLSMGGYLTFAFYKAYPDVVQGMILSDTKAKSDTEEEKNSRLEYAADAEERGPQAVMDRQFAKLISDRTKQERPEVAKQVETWIRNTTPQALGAGLKALAARSNYEELLPIVNVPTLVLVGKEDQISTPEIMKEMSSCIPGVRYHEIEGAGHLSAVENPKEWAQVVGAFLKQF